LDLYWLVAFLLDIMGFKSFRAHNTKYFSKFPFQSPKFKFCLPFMVYQTHFWNGLDKLCSLCTRLRVWHRKLATVSSNLGRSYEIRCNVVTVYSVFSVYSISTHQYLMLNLRLPPDFLTWTVTILRLFHLAQLSYMLVSYIATLHNTLTISNITRTCWTSSIQWLPST
jgi:hypothetical protein